MCTPSRKKGKETAWTYVKTFCFWEGLLPAEIIEPNLPCRSFIRILTVLEEETQHPIPVHIAILLHFESLGCWRTLGDFITYRPRPRKRLNHHFMTAEGFTCPPHTALPSLLLAHCLPITCLYNIMSGYQEVDYKMHLKEKKISLKRETNTQNGIQICQGWWDEHIKNFKYL